MIGGAYRSIRPTPLIPQYDMEVTILGSGTAVPDPDRFPSGVLVSTADQVIVVDIGPGVLRRIAQSGCGAGQITTVLLTHYHTDHTADLAALLFALRNPAFAGRQPLRLIGGAGLHTFLGHLTAAWPWLRPSGYELDVCEIGPGPFALGAIRVTAFPIEHTDASLAYRIESPGGAGVAISGDADVCDGLISPRTIDAFALTVDPPYRPGGVRVASIPNTTRAPVVSEE